MTMKIIHTMGVYANGDRKHNGVTSDHIDDHIKYNLTFRPGRALFVDGKCVHRGNLSQESCDAIERELAAKPVSMRTDTMPYH
jgi:hypothetical protein